MSSYKNIKITVIGGSGFVGTNLCKHLKISGYNFEIIGSQEIKAHSFKKDGPDTTIVLCRRIDEQLQQ